MIPLELPMACDGYRKKLTDDHAMYCQKGGLVLIRHDNAAKEWGALGPQGLTPSNMYYEPCINIRMVQGERPGAGAKMTEGEAWNNAATGNQENGSRRSGGTGEVTLGEKNREEDPEEMRANVGTHGLWK